MVIRGIRALGLLGLIIIMSMIEGGYNIRVIRVIRGI